MGPAEEAAVMAPTRPRPAGNRLPTSRDIEVGRRLRLLRGEARLTLKDLAARVNVTYVQLHRYETGSSRVPAGRLIELAQVLGVRVEAIAGDGPALAPGIAGDIPALLDAFQRITDVGRRALLLGVARSLAEAEHLAEASPGMRAAGGLGA